MDRRRFITQFGKLLPVAGAALYLLSDKRNLIRADVEPFAESERFYEPAETEILFLASLAPSGHNTQPWFVQYLEPFHWIIGNDRSRWLPAVDPNQRETILSIGAFLQNIEYAAGHFGYACDWKLLAARNSDEKVVEVSLKKSAYAADFAIETIRSRRTVRSNFANEAIRTNDLDDLLASDPEFFHYLPPDSDASRFINEQTIEANRLQAYREPAQQELRDWIRFSNREARKHRDGLTTGSMEIDGFAGWFVRNLYTHDNVLSEDFRERGLNKVSEQVSAHGGWILATSNDESVAGLLEAGRRMQRLFLRVRERSIAIHPMTQILEEPATCAILNQAVGITESVQFILRAGYVNDYPPPVSMRRPVGWFLRT